jgi:diguanylate cyclase (GGDEF)-like protein
VSTWERRLTVAAARSAAHEQAQAPAPVPPAPRALPPAEVQGPLLAALAGTPDLVAVFDADLGLRWANGALADLVATAWPDTPAPRLADLLDDISWARYQSTVGPALARHGRWRGVLAVRAGVAVPVSVVLVDVAGDGVVLVARAAPGTAPRPPVADPAAAGAVPVLHTGAPDPADGTPAVGYGRARAHLAAVLRGRAHRSVVVLVLAFDGLRAVVDGLARDAGDEVLHRCAERLRGRVPATASVDYLGGDQFMVVVPGAGAVDGLAQAIALRAAATPPLELDEGTVAPEVSVGFAVAGSGASDPDEVVRHAERALARARRGGGGRVEVYTDELGRQEVGRLTRGDALRRALDRDDVVLHFQPIVAVPTGEVLAAEALLRLGSGEVAPASAVQLIDAAESTGLMDRLGERVLALACRQLAAWPERRSGQGLRMPLSVSINMTPRQLADRHLPAVVLEALDSTDVDPTRLCVEITERTLIEADDAIDDAIAFLRDLGVSVGLDDFGGAASSLGYLRRFPLDFVKVDRSLVAGLGRREADDAIVASTVDLAHQLGMHVVAVGVETAAQLDRLRALRCDRAQGHLFSPALSVAELTTWLRSS